MSNISGDGTAFDSPAEVPIVTSFSTFAKSVVHARPKKEWKGENFGFDWVRIRDSSIDGDIPYNENMGRYENQGNTNSTSSGSFKHDASVFASLVRTYFPNDKKIAWKYEVKSGENDKDRLKREAKFKYFIPVMTLLKGKTAELSLKIEMDTSKTAPTRIDITASDSSIYTLSVNQITNLSKKDHLLSVACSNTTFDEQHLLFEAVYTDADGKEKKEKCGMLRILPNHKERVLKVLFIDMIFKDNSSNEVEGKIKTDHITFAERILNQAMVKLEYKTIEYEMEDNNAMRSRLLTNFINGQFTNYSGVGGAIFSANSLYKYMKENKLLQKYEDYIFVVSLDAKCEDTTTDSFTGTTSTATTAGATIPVARPFDVLFPYDTPSELMKHYEITENPGKEHLEPDEKLEIIKLYGGFPIVMFKPTDKETLVHEILHAVGLYHSFDHRSTYVYKGDKTENLMDYSSFDRISTWHWQWKVLWDYCDQIRRDSETREKEQRQKEVDALEDAHKRLQKELKELEIDS